MSSKDTGYKPQSQKVLSSLCRHADTVKSIHVAEICIYPGLPLSYNYHFWLNFLDTYDYYFPFLFLFIFSPKASGTSIHWWLGISVQLPKVSPAPANNQEMGKNKGESLPLLPNFPQKENIGSNWKTHSVD